MTPAVRLQPWGPGDRDLLGRLLGDPAMMTHLGGAALASDAFFPFSDGPQLAVDAGATTIIQPGGSRRDPEVVEAADAAGLAMVFTRRRHFRH